MAISKERSVSATPAFIRRALHMSVAACARSCSSLRPRYDHRLLSEDAALPTSGAGILHVTG
jgi:hypothetical protein